MRKIIQIAFQVAVSSSTNEDNIVSDVWSSDTLHALCDDGTIWFLTSKEEKWERWELPEIPQDK